MIEPIILGAAFGLTALLFFRLGDKSGYRRGIADANALTCGEIDVSAG